MRSKSKKNFNRKNLLSFEQLEQRALMAIVPFASDNFEENDTQVLSKQIEVRPSNDGEFGAPAGTFNVGVIGQLNMDDSFDWFAFDLGIAGTPQSGVSIGFQNSQGNLDMALVNPNGQQIRGSFTQNDNEVISLNGLQAGRYFVKIFGVNKAINPNYTLVLVTPTAVQPAPANPTIDLQGALLNVDDYGIWGSTVAVQSRVFNAGNNATIGGVAVQYFLSTDSTVSLDDVPLSLSTGVATMNFPSVAGNSFSQVRDARLRLPAVRPANLPVAPIYYIVAFTDALFTSAETNENNNSGQIGWGKDWEPISIFDPPTPPAKFDIKILAFGMTPEQVRVFEAAADRWESIIVGDLIDVETFPGSGIFIDDILIYATVAPIDGGGGILAQASPDILRLDTGLPLTGSMEFDSADIAAMQGRSDFLNTVTHEMGHALGLGGTMWSSKGLVQNQFTSKAVYIGANGVAGFNKISGLPPVTSFPIEVHGGPGSAFSHWEEDIMQTELMTPTEGPGNYSPISAVTVGALADLGYTVNFNAAEAFSLQNQPNPVPSVPLPIGFPIGGGPGFLKAADKLVAGPDYFTRNGWIDGAPYSPTTSSQSSTNNSNANDSNTQSTTDVSKKLGDVVVADESTNNAVSTLEFARRNQKSSSLQFQAVDSLFARFGF